MPAARKTNPENTPRPQRRPGATLEARENQLVSLAVDLAEKQLLDGTASAQVITHYLKLGTSRERLEQEKLRRENLLLQSRTEQIAQQGRMEALYEQAIKAMRSYNGITTPEDEDDSY